MKKFIAMILISLSLSFVTFQSTYAANTFTEGVYKAADFNFSPENKYVVQNVSGASGVFIQLFDENQNLLQSIHLTSNSDKYNLLPLKPDYRIVIVGNGNVYIE